MTKTPTLTPSVPLDQLLATSPQNLAFVQFTALKVHAIQRFKLINELLAKDDFAALEQMLAHSPAGDGHGSDNQVIDFSDTGLGDHLGGPTDFGNVVAKLKDLRAIHRGEKKK